MGKDIHNTYLIKDLCGKDTQKQQRSRRPVLKNGRRGEETLNRRRQARGARASPVCLRANSAGTEPTGRRPSFRPPPPSISFPAATYGTTSATLCFQDQPALGSEPGSDCPPTVRSQSPRNHCSPWRPHQSPGQRASEGLPYVPLSGLLVPRDPVTLLDLAQHLGARRSARS